MNYQITPRILVLNTLRKSIHYAPNLLHSIFFNYPWNVRPYHAKAPTVLLEV